MSSGEYRELSASDLVERWRERDPLEYIDEAARQEHVEYGDADTALRWLLKLAWSDLQSARRRALNGSWSIECEHEVHRIAGLTRLVGPISWREVPVDLVLDGWFEQIHASVGVPTPVSEEERGRAREVLARRRR